MPAADQFEQQMLVLINAERASAGLQPLRLNSKLNSSAELHSKWMLDADVFSHTGINGTTATQRMQAAGYDFQGTWMNGENIAWQSERGAAGIADDVINLHTALMNSPPHRANILTPNFAEIGIGIEIGNFTASDGTTYQAVMVTENFALSGADNGGDGAGGTGGTGGTTPPLDQIGSLISEKMAGTLLGELMDGRDGHDRLYGLGGDDTLIGDNGNDRLYGGADNDQLSGGAGNDFVQGDAGNDELHGGDGADKMAGCDGQDTGWGDAGADKMSGGLGDDTLYGGADNDKLAGDAGNDQLSGDDGLDQLSGGDGDDQVNGGAGNDTLSGGSGNDTLSGDAGNDRMSGGLGEDVFVFHEGSGVDRVMDFVNDVDSLAFDASFWTGIEDATAFVDTYAHVVGSSVVFDFGDGDIVTVSGIKSLALLYDDVMSIA